MVHDGVCTGFNQLKASGADRTACLPEAPSKSEPLDRGLLGRISGVWGVCGERIKADYGMKLIIWDFSMNPPSLERIWEDVGKSWAL